MGCVWWLMTCRAFGAWRWGQSILGWLWKVMMRGGLCRSVFLSRVLCRRLCLRIMLLVGLCVRCWGCRGRVRTWCSRECLYTGAGCSSVRAGWARSAPVGMFVAVALLSEVPTVVGYEAVVAAMCLDVVCGCSGWSALSDAGVRVLDYGSWASKLVYLCEEGPAVESLVSVLDVRLAAVHGVPAL